jgi:hypothetical protein
MRTTAGVPRSERFFVGIIAASITDTQFQSLKVSDRLQQWCRKAQQGSLCSQGFHLDGDSTDLTHYGIMLVDCSFVTGNWDFEPVISGCVIFHAR